MGNQNHGIVPERVGSSLADAEQAWVDWRGGERPVDADTLIRPRYGDRELFIRSAWAHDWSRPCRYRVAVFGDNP